MTDNGGVMVWVGLLALLVFPMFLVGLWAAIVLTLAKLSGWGRLSQRYRARTPYSGPDVATSGHVGVVRYRHLLRLGMDDAELHLRVPTLFALGHPPLSVPWQRVRVTPEDRRFDKLVRFDIDGIPLTVQLAGVQRLAKVHKLPPAVASAIQELA